MDLARINIAVNLFSQYVTQLQTKLSNIQLTIEKARNTKNDNTSGNDSSKATNFTDTAMNQMNLLKQKKKIELEIQQYKQYIVELNNLPNYLKMYNLSIETIVNELPIHLHHRDLPLSLTSLSLITHFSVIFKIYPILLLMICDYIEHPPVAITNLIDSKNLWNPSEPIKIGFKYDPELEKTVDGKFRYLINMSSQDLRAYLLQNDVHDDVKFNSKIFLQLSNQSRWGNLWQQILSVILHYDVISQADAWKNTHLIGKKTFRSGKDLMSVKTIAYIMSKFSLIPFFFSNKGILKIENASTDVWGTSIIPLLYSLLELAKEEIGCNVDDTIIVEMIKYRIQGAYASFETDTLNNKDVHTGLMKLITFKLGNSIKIHHSSSGYTPKVVEIPENIEIESIEHEESALSEKLRTTTSLEFQTWFFNNVKLLTSTDSFKNTEHARYLMSCLNVFSNVGIYYKTALTFEIVKSIEPQIRMIIPRLQPVEYFTYHGMTMECTLDYGKENSVFFEMHKLAYDSYTEVMSEVQRNDYEEFFVSQLTNRSQGEKVDLPELRGEKELDPRQKLLYAVAQSRLAGFIAEPQKYFNVSEFLKALQKEAKCTVRFQNFRRARVVEIVPNVDQLAYAVMLRMFNALKRKNPIISVGKQLGGIVDMTPQLQATGSSFTTSWSSDVQAMDASTQTTLATFSLQVLAEWINDNNIGPDRYFCFSTQDVDIKHVDGTLRTKRMKALSLCIYSVLYQRAHKNYILEDRIVGISLKIAAFLFESGRFDTTSTHSLTLMRTHQIADKLTRLYLPDISHQTRVQAHVFGDDEYKSYTNFVPETRLKFVQTYENNYRRVMKSIGYDIDPVFSNYFGDFLQQLAFNGVQVPKSARSSVFCDERSNTRNRDVVSQISILSEVVLSASQRTYSPENVLSLVTSAWAIIKSVRSEYFKIYGKRWAKYIYTLGDRTVFSYPFTQIYLPPLNFPNKRWELGPYHYLSTSCLNTVGDFKYCWIVNSLLTDEEKVNVTKMWLDKVHENMIKTPSGYYYNVWELIKNRLDHTEVLDALVLNLYNRSNEGNARREKVLKQDILNWGTNLGQHYDQRRMSDSAQAWETLRRRHGLKIPANISYWQQPVEKVRNMFNALNESDLETLELNDSFSLFLKTWASKDPPDIIKKINGLSIIFTLDTIDIPPLETHSKLPLIPGYRDTSDFNAYMRMSGSGLFSTFDTTRILGGFNAKYGKVIDIMALVKYGSIARSLGDEAFSLFKLVIDLPDELKLSLDSLIEQKDVVLTADLYNSGFRPSTLFGLHGGTLFIKRFCEQKFDLSQAAMSILEIIGRDYFLHFIHTSYGKKLIMNLTPQSLLYIEKGKVQRAKARAALFQYDG